MLNRFFLVASLGVLVVSSLPSLQPTLRGAEISTHPMEDQVVGYISEIPLHSLREDTHDNTIAYAEAPRWVYQTTFPTQQISCSLDLPKESRWLLVDHQLNADSQTTYHHYAIELRSDEDVIHQSIIPISIDLNQQDLLFHEVKVHRHGRKLDGMRHSALYLPASQANETAFTIKDSVTLYVEQLQVGDILEYSYSVKETAKKTHDAVIGSFHPSSSLPIRRAYYRVVGSAGKPPEVRVFNGAPHPEWHTADDGSWEMIAQFFNLVPASSEPGQPEWFSNLPWIQVSEFKDWSDVASYMAQYPLPSNDRIDALWDQWSEAEAWEDADLRSNSEALCAYVREQPLPNPFDRAILLQALLKKLSIKSHIALVSTTHRQHIDEGLPSPENLDHALVQAHIGEMVFWLDPSSERSPRCLLEGSAAFYGKALVLDSSDPHLEVIENDCISPDVEVYATYSIDDSETEARLQVTTYLRDDNAQAMRRLLKSETEKRIESGFQALYESLHGEIEALSPLSINDDIEKNRMVIKEEYLLKNPWTQREDGRTRSLTIHPVQLDEELDQLQPGNRTAPLALEYPTFVTEYICIRRTGHPWLPRQNTLVLTSEAISCTLETEANAQQWVQRLSFQTLHDAVSVEELQQHSATIAQLKEQSALTVITPVPLQARLPQTVSLLYTLQSFIGLTAIGAAYHKRRIAGSLLPPY